jgi:DNA repair protein RadC
VYRGINVLLLNLRAMAEGYASNRWLTFAAGAAVGAHVRKGEQGTQIVFFKMHELDKDGPRRPSPMSGAWCRCCVPSRSSTSTRSTVLPEAMRAQPLRAGPAGSPSRRPSASWRPRARGLQHGGSKAFYAPGPDLIQMPPRQAFDSAADYYATALHELTHWTGHPSRCNRPLGMPAWHRRLCLRGAGRRNGFGVPHRLLRPGRSPAARQLHRQLAAGAAQRQAADLHRASQAQKAADFLLAFEPGRAGLPCGGGCVSRAAVIEQALQLLAAEVQGANALTSPAVVKDFLRLKLGDRPHEVFAVVFLDAQHRVLAIEELFRGTLSQTSVYPREVVKEALARNAAAVVLVHNHPSGSAEPSRADEFLTNTLRQALALVDVRVLDHLVVTRTSVLSFAERGLL